MTARPEPRAALVGWSAAALTALLAVADVVVLLAAGEGFFTADLFGEGFPVITLATVIMAAVGGAVIAREPHNRIGWLLCAGGLGTMTGLLANDIGRAILEGGVPGSQSLGHWLLWSGNLTGAPYAIALVGALFLLVPNGRPPSRRWWPVLGGFALALVLAVVGYAFVPPSQVLPGDVSDPGPVAQVLISSSFLLLTLCMALAATALVRRLRRARGIERQQLRWIAVSAAALAIALLFLLTAALIWIQDEVTPNWAVAPLYFAYLGVTVATGFAVLRYRLYDVDLIIGRAVVLGVLVAFVTAGYVVVVLVVAAVVGSPADGRFWPSLLATAVVALAFQPLRRRVRGLADRVVYGERAAPYEALAGLNQQLAVSLDVEELLPRVAEAAARAVRAPYSRVQLLVPEGLPVDAAWPPGDREEPRPEYAAIFDVRHGGEQVGTIAVGASPGGSLARHERVLLTDLSAQSALAFRNAQIVAVLRARSTRLARDAADIEASRRRLVVAAQAERGRIARAINRDVLPHLATLPASIDRLGVELDGDPAASGALDRIDVLKVSTTEALEALRVITRGVFPAALARRGLVPALRARFQQNAQPVEWEVDPELEGVRFDGRAEGALYLCVVESVTDLDPPVHVSLRLEGDAALALRIEGSERVTGWHEPDHMLMADRLESLGGTANMRRSNGRVVVEVNVAVAPLAGAGVLPL